MAARLPDALCPAAPRRSSAAALVGGLALGLCGCTGEGEPPADDAGEESPRCLELGDLDAPPRLATTQPTCGPDEGPESPDNLATLALSGVLAQHQLPIGGMIDLDLDCEVAAIDQGAAGEAAEVTLRCVETGAEGGLAETLEVPLHLSAAAARASLCEGERLDLWVLAVDAFLCGGSHAYGLTRADGALLIAGARGTYNLLQDRAAPVDVSLSVAGCAVIADACVETERAAIAVASGGGPPGLIYEGTRRRVDGSPAFVVQADRAEVRRVSDPCDDCSSVDVVIVRSEASGG